MDEIVNKELKNKDGRTESFIKRFFNKAPQNLFGLVFVFTLIISGFFMFSEQAQASITDTVSGAIDAYGLRTLKSSYSGPLVRVIRTDGGEADVFADTQGNFSLTSPVTIVSGSSTATTLSDFITSTNAFVKIWYDQIGGINVSQTTTANQPQIVNSGSIITDITSNNPTINFNGTTNILQSVSALSSSQPLTVFSISTGGTLIGTNTPRLFMIGNAPNRVMYQSSGGMYSGNFLANTSQSDQHSNQVMSMTFNSTSSQLWVNGTSVGSGSSGNNTISGTISIGGSDLGVSTTVFHGNISEFIIYGGSITTSNRQIIENDEMVYNNFPKVASLSTTALGIPGAIYAYGLRQLVPSYVAPIIRIRLTNGDEADVLTDTQGGVSVNSPITVISGSSTATILSDFITGTDAFVEIWYDQVGNDNLIQATVTAQPKIFSNGLLITDGLSSKPAIQFNSTSATTLGTQFAISKTQPFSVSVVSSISIQPSGTARLFGIGLSPNNALYQIGSSGGIYAGAWLSNTLINTPYNQNVLSMIFNLANTQLFKNGVSIGSGSTSNQPIMGKLYVGSGTGGGLPIDGKISEFIVYNSALSSSNRQIIEENQISNFENSPSFQITSPSRDVAAEPTVATISYVDQRGYTVYVPYIQTSQNLSVASNNSSLIPSGGGVKFVLNEGLSGQQVSYDMISPFTSTFNGLPKGTYTLDAYIVDSGQNVVSGSSYHDRAIDIGIGDIYVAAGDSITKGSLGTVCGGAEISITDWTQTSQGTASLDNRNYCQWASQVSAAYVKSWMPGLNDELESYLGYPVFILNEGYAGWTAAGYLSNPMGLTAWQSRVSGLHPNKWLILLGTNDSGSTSTLVTNMTNIVNSIKSTYGASSSSIYLGLPVYAASRPFVQTIITPLQNLVTSQNLGTGPNFNTYFFNHPELFGDNPAIHPNVSGNLQMARLWALSMIKPTNLSVSQNTGTVTVNWNSIASLDAIPTGTSSITGYKIKYGTSTGTYSTIVDAGNVTTKTIEGLSDNQQYFFTVQAYGADQETSDLASETSLTINLTPPSTPISSIAPGLYNSTQSVPIIATGSDYIKYATDAIPPTCSDGTSYGGPISVVTTQTIYVRACTNNGESSTGTFAYTIDTTIPLTPIATPSSGIYNSTQTVLLTADGSDSIRYSTSETPADCSADTLYSDSTPIVVSSTQTIYVRACDLANNSSTGSFTYTLDTTPPETPTATPSAGSFNSTQSVTLSATSSDYIKYDTSLVTSCSAGISYEGPISIPSSETIYVLACDNAGNSSTQSFAYVISPVISHSSGGSSVSSRFNNLVAMGNLQAAENLKQEFPNQFSNNQIPLTPSTQTTSIITSVHSTPIVLSRIIKLSTTRMWGDDVLSLQTLLNTKGYNVGTPDGNFGPKTQAAVVAFQTANGLTPDGSVGTNTLKYLNGNQTTTTISPITIQPAVTRILKLSIPRMIGDDVLALQTYLSTNGYDVGALDGVLGNKTKSAVIAFQTANGLIPDGVLGPKTRALINAVK
ncbi:MAG TPA: peptidoglycan-binding protein [Paludibacter sp.]